MRGEQGKEEEHVEAEEVVLGDNGASAEEVLVPDNVTLRAGMNRVRLAGRVGGYGGGEYTLKIHTVQVKYGGLVLIAGVADVYSHYVVGVVGEEAVRLELLCCRVAVCRGA